MLVVEKPVDDQDLKALAAATAGVLVLTPFPAPTRVDATLSEEFEDWGYANAPVSEQRELDITNQNSVYGSLGRYRWTLDPNWRHQLLVWVESRCNHFGIDTLFNSEETSTWLDQFDPDDLVFRAPSDVMAICRIFHHLPRTKRPNASSPHAGRALQSHIRRMNSREVDVVNRLAEGHWRRTDLPWRAALSWPQWREIHEQDLVGDVGMSQIDGVASASPPKTVRRPKPPLTRKSNVELEAARTQGLLQEVSRGGAGDFALRPSILADLVARDLVIQDIKSGSIGDWGPGCFDIERQHLIDAGIRTIKTADLLTAVRQIYEAKQWDEASIGASETLFMTLGERIAGGEELPAEMLHLARIVLSRYSHETFELVPQPWSRSAMAFADDDNSLRWIAACWSWSLTKRPTDLSLSLEWSLIFPGWNDHAWNGLPLPAYPSEQYDVVTPCPPRWRRLMRIALAVILKLDGTPVSETSEVKILHPLLLAASASAKWPVEPHWWSVVISNKWAEEFVFAEISRIKTTEAIEAYWRSLLDFLASAPRERTFLSPDMLLLRSSIWKWALSKLTPHGALQGLTQTQIQTLLERPSILPPEFLKALIEVAEPSNPELMVKIISICPQESIGALKKWLGTSAGPHAARRIWGMKPEAAWDWIRANADMHTEAVADLVMATPPIWSLEVAKFLIKNPDVLTSDSRYRWVRDRVSTVQGHAGVLLSALRHD